MRQAPGVLGEPDPAEPRLGPGTAFGAGQPLDGEREFDVRAQGAPGEQGVLLEHEGAFGGRGGQGASVLRDLSAERGQKAGEGAQEGRLATTGGADDGQDLPRGHVEIDPVQHGSAGAPQSDAAQREAGAGAGAGR